MDVTKRPRIVGHRGAPQEATENTLASIAAAVRAGATGVEVDLRLAGDGTVAVIHDPDVDRTTAGHGRVADMGARDLDALGVPIMDEVIALCDRLGLWLDLELKEAQPGIAAALAGWRPEAGGMVSSFLPQALALVAEADGHIKRGLLTLPGAEAEDALAAATGQQAWNPFVLTVLGAPDCVAAAHRAGLEIHVWTVDDPDQIRAVAALGVDGIITNLPGVALHALRE